MEKTEILSRVDHTLLKQESTPEQIKTICRDAIECSAASVCIPPCYVKLAKECCADKMKVCTVIGFPNGYNAAEVKAFETKKAVLDGADEIDMVINIAAAREGNFDLIKNEIALVRGECEGKILKVIIETCYLDKETMAKLCRVIEEAGGDYVKTSTGFAAHGATFEDVDWLAKNAGSLEVKASGGIRSFEDAQKYITLGADRIGASALVNNFLEK
ncbi:MAG: deoxyribose-phosphate aldolase [Oscillospiraceae bacterium]|nr:deoxyribose-phosphate aldolase [Oscillospiraceae bacterium]